MINFTESRMSFSFEESDVFLIEKCDTYLSIQKGIKVCECIATNSSYSNILLIEAKSSFSNPQINKEDFSSNVHAITEKFINTLLLYYGLLLNRPFKTISKLPHNLDLNKIIEKKQKIIPILIINNFKKEWLPPVKDALNNEIKKYSFSKILLLEDIQVLTKEMAAKKQIVKE